MEMLKGFEEFQQKVKHLVERTNELTTPLITELNELTGQSLDLQTHLDKLREALDKNKKVVLSVVGQVKTGKSTLLNSLVFGGETILPRAATPKTARLTVILPADGDSEPGNTAYFYTLEDWKALEEHARMGGDEEGEVVEAALAKLGEAGIAELLGTQAEFPLFEMESYVAEDGKFTDVVKYVEMRVLSSPYSELKIVDTPGTNDTVRSRVKVTTEFLKETDATLFLSSPTQFLDSEDLDLAFRNIPAMSEGIVVIPHFDILYKDMREEFLSVSLPGMTGRAHQRAVEQGAGEHTLRLIDRFFRPENSVCVSAMSHQIGLKLAKGLPLDSEEEQPIYDSFESREWPYESAEELLAVSGIEQLAEMIDQKITRRKGQIILSRPFERLRSEFAVCRSKNERTLDDKRKAIEKMDTQIQELQSEAAVGLKDVKELRDVVHDALSRFAKNARGEYSAPALPHVEVKTSKTDALIAEATEVANTALEEALKDCKRTIQSAAEDLQKDLSVLSGKKLEKHTFESEVASLLQSLHRQLRQIQSSGPIDVSVSMSWDVFDGVRSLLGDLTFGLFGKHNKRKKLEEAWLKAKPNIKKALRGFFFRTVEEWESEALESKVRIEMKLDQEIAERSRRVDELQKAADDKATQLPILKAKWEKSCELQNRLDGALKSLTPQYEEVRILLSADDKEGVE